MIVHVANPIYDSVFKYIMEDPRIAKTVLSALLKKDVLDVKIRPHEYANTTRDSLSMFRIDFAANVREESGEEHIILIELQKTWLSTETLRFRQYLGVQYGNKHNIRQDSPKGYAYPMVAVYLLGHRVGEIEEPVLYVNHKPYNYDGNEVRLTSPEPFLESLTHDSIIVQLPRLRGKVNNKLEKVLSVFDQSNMDKDDTQVLRIDENKYEGDDDMMYMIHRLTAAAANADMRQDMNVEDEYFKAIEDRDTAIIERETTIKEKEKIIAEKDASIAEKDASIAEKDASIAEKDASIAEKDASIAEKDASIAEKDASIAEKDASIAEKDASLIQMAKLMLANGMTEDIVAKAMNISVDKLKNLLQ